MKEAIVLRWIAKAEEDLQAASYLLQTPKPPRSVIAFHCQQATEKYLKAYLTFWNVRVPKTHDLVLLFELCLSKDPDFASISKEHIASLTFYAVSVRYPDDFYIPSLEELEEALALANAVRAIVRRKLHIE